MIKKLYTTTLVFILILNAAYGQDALEQIISSGNEAYASKNYTKAIEDYSSAITALDNQEESFSLHYNLGNAYYKSDNLGKAILHWEKAKLLSPTDKDLQKNLSIAKSSIKGDVIPVKPFFLLNWWKGIQSYLSSMTWGLLGIVLLWLGITGILTWMFSKHRTYRKYGFIAGIALSTLSILPFLWGFGKSSIENDSQRAIITINNTQLRAAPDGAGDFLIYEGTELEILDQVGEWSQVRLVNSDIGWVKKDEYENI